MTTNDHNTVVIPDKFYFKIGEVGELAGVPPYVLRFWETEFKRIRPKRTDAGQRLYRKQDVELILRIKHLLYDRKFTIEGARQYLKQRTKEDHKPSPAQPLQDIDEIRGELIRIRDLIDRHHI
ncbi:MAG: MerR family transcriptional regulator [Deltaproteobacteria bacterium]|nr:MAG: MerR family transcriptional regulator [Deltaproteobacteria bacterium]